MNSRCLICVAALSMLVVVPAFAEDTHGDTPLAAFPVEANGGLLDACIDVAGDMDFFLFEAQSGRRYILQTRRSSPEMDTVLYLFASDGQTILQVAADSGDDASARIEWQSPQSGTYFVMVRHALSTVGTGCYQLSIGAVQADDHGDTPVTATPLPSTGLSVPGYIESASDVDVFLFVAEAGYDYVVAVTNLIGGVQPTLALLAADGSTVLATAAADGQDAVHLRWAASESATHFLEIRGTEPATGGYDVSVTQGGYADDHGNVWSASTPVSADGTIVGGRIDVPGDADVFSVDMREGGQYTIRVAGPDGIPQYTAILLASDGITTVASSVPTSAGAAGIEWTARADAIHYVEVRHALDAGTGTYSVSVQSVLQLTVVGHFNPQGGYTLDVAVVGENAYLIVGSKGLLVVDVSDPADPLEIGSHSTPGYSQALAAVGRRLVMANRGDGISILDISDPSRPHELGRYDTMGSAQDVAVDGSLAYVADQRGGLLIVDISSPSHPSLVGSLTTRGYAEGVAVEGQVAYVATGDVGVEVIDISDPSRPRGISELDLPGEAHAVVAYGDTIYLAAGYRGVRVIDVSDPTAPSEITSLITDGEAHGLFLGGSYLYVADYTEGLAVLSLADPRAPQPVARVDTPGYAVAVYVTDGQAFVADRESGLRIIELLP
ncbi:MAG: pre-peptidase C-terminal domain-containing protein [Candidatus Bipolaricaulota bacterium]|nr:MAG: pre-peptidase C-terminal domain-containing protein [Candidatus Bipolaricaulota bacterium]